NSLRQKGDRFALTSQVLSEFVHVVTDAKRFAAPLTMPQALERAQIWWDASEVDRVWSDESTLLWFFTAMTKYRLGRKRVLDTLLAGTYRSADVTSLLTLNASDFTVFGEFVCVPLAKSTV